MLNRGQIERLIEEGDLLEGFPHLETQVQPHGFDVTVGEIFEFSGRGRIDFSNDEREMPDTKNINLEKKNKSDEYGWWDLDRGAYKVRTNERVNLPNDLIALGFPRSSLMRMGAFAQNAVWDAGFSGKGEFILVVENEEGVEIKENARVVQLVFIPVERAEKGYDGKYGEIE